MYSNTPTERYPSVQRVVSTAKGDILMESFCSAERIEACTLDPQFGVYARYKSLYTRKESLVQLAGTEGANIVLALTQNSHIIGFGLLVHPEPDERWFRVGPGVMIELKAIEVCRDWRSTGIARQIVEMLLSHPRLEDMIVYLVGYSWTWDLDGTGKSAQEYRQMLFGLFEPFGFREFQTNEPNICLKPENMLMARIGARVSADIQNRFKWIRFGVEP
ncbi:MAG: N-acetyltransferase [Thermodesulfobacteriota bacterium]